MTNENYPYAPQVVDAADTLKQKIGRNIDLFVVAGSGFRSVLPQLEGGGSISMSEIPHMPTPKVSGHGSQLIWGQLHSKTVLIATGRVHLYEGKSCDDVVFAVRMVSRLGTKGILLTNAAGSVDRKLPAGTLVAIKDQINLTGHSAEGGAQRSVNHFTDMMNCYDPEWRARLNAELNLPEGVYAGLTGPAYETLAEAKMLALLGAHTVGMSTVQECIAARTLGMKVLGLSLVTNLAGGLGGAITHSEVLNVTETNKPALQLALNTAIKTF